MESQIISLPALPSIHFALVLNSTVLIGILGIFFVLYFIVSCVLFYHWTAYGMGNHGIYVGETLFVIISVLLFLVAFISATYY